MNIINTKKEFLLSDENVLEEGVKFIESTLKEAGLNRKLVMKAVLTSEETIAQLLEHAADKGKLKIAVHKMFGKTDVVLTAPGTEYDPYATVNGEDANIEGLEDEDVQMAIRSILLKSQSENYKFNYKNGINRVKIVADAAEKSMLKSTMIALALGLLFGLLLQMVIPGSVADGIIKYSLDPIETIFMNSLKIITAPIVFFSIASCVSQFKDLSQLGRIGSKVMTMYLTTTTIAVVLAMLVFILFKPGEFGAALSMVKEAEAVTVDTNVDTSILHTMIGIVPNNFVKPFVESDTLQVIFLGLLCGIAVGMIGEYAETLKTFFDACNSLFLTITTMIAKIIPLAVFCSVSIMVKKMGGASLVAVAGYAVTQITTIGCMLVVYGIIILVVGHLNPFTFFKKNREGMLTSFTLCSSSAAMPTNMRTCTEKLGISRKVCSFSIPLGATVNMDGACTLITISTLFLARVYGIEVPASSFFSLALTIILLSLGAPGVPGSAIVCIGVVLAQIGVPIEAIGLIIGINPILDMFDTMLNTTGDVMAALVVAKKEKLLDLELFKS